MKKEIYKIIDKYIGTPLCLITGIINKLLQKEKKITKLKRIAIIKLWAIGDSVLTLPMIKSLRATFPKIEIDVVARKNNIEVFKNNSDINKLILFEWNNLFNIIKLLKHYDLVIDTEPWMRLSALISTYISKKSIGFGGQMRSLNYTIVVPFNKQKHMVENYLEMAKAAGAKKLWKKLVPLRFSSKDKKIVDRFLKKENLTGDIIGICPGGAEPPTRLWAIESYAKLADKLIKKLNVSVLFVGNTSDSKNVEKIRFLMRYKQKSVSSIGINLTQLFYSITKCRLFISNDTGPMHLAAAQGVKTIGLFGPNTPVLWRPYSKTSAFIYKKVPCSPCIDNEKGYVPDCLRKKNKYLCMRLITVEEVFKKAKEMLMDVNKMG